MEKNNNKKSLNKRIEASIFLKKIFIVAIIVTVILSISILVDFKLLEAYFFKLSMGSLLKVIGYEDPTSIYITYLSYFILPPIFLSFSGIMWINRGGVGRSKSMLLFISLIALGIGAMIGIMNFFLVFALSGGIFGPH